MFVLKRFFFFRLHALPAFFFLFFVGVMGLNAAPVLSGHQAKYLYLPGENNQMIFRVNVQSKGGTKLSGMCFTLKATNAADVVAARLYRNAAPFFSPKSDNEDKAELVEEAKINKDKILIQFDESQSADEMNYFLAVDVSPEAKGGNKLDAQLDFVIVDGKKISKLKNADPKGTGVVDAGKQRLAVYYRAEFLLSRAKGLLTQAGMNGLTNIILFQVQPAANGSVVPLAGKGSSSADMSKLTKAAALLKTLRGDRDIKITLGVKTGEFKAVCQEQKLCEKLAKELVATVLKLGLDGFDLDYEYPESAAEWRRFCNFVSILRDEMSPHDLMLTTAISAFYCVPSVAVLDQFDLIHAMSYDHGGDQHSSFADHEKDLATLTQGLHQPAKKVLIGVPMYTNGTNDAGKVMWTSQRGWRDVVSYFRKLNVPIYDHVNNVQGWQYDSYRHSYNGRDLLNRKCAHLLENNYGGLMVWGFETDVDYDDLQSEMRFMHEVFIPEQGYETQPMNRDSSVSPELKYLQIKFDEPMAIKATKPIELWECPKRDYSIKSGSVVFDNIAAKQVAVIARSNCKMNKDGTLMRVTLPAGCLQAGKSYFVKIAEESLAHQSSKKNFKGILHDAYWNFSCGYLSDGRFIQQLYGLPKESSWTYSGAAGVDYDLQGGSLTLKNAQAGIYQCSQYAPKKGDSAELIIRLQEGGDDKKLKLSLYLVSKNTEEKKLLETKELSPYDAKSANLIYWKYDFTQEVPAGCHLGVGITHGGKSAVTMREVVLEVPLK